MMSEDSSIDAVVHALYETVSGGAGEKRTWARMRSLFFRQARLVRTFVSEGSCPQAQTMDVEEYIRDVSPYFQEHDFYEKEIARRVDRFGNIAQVFSTYEARHSELDTRPFKRGINSIQLFHDGKRWWIVNMIWDNERPDNPLSGRYLPQSST